METTVNVIIPAFNARETLPVAIASCCIQSMINELWITVIDDCSEKPYDDIIESFRPFFGDRIQLIRNEKNMGPGLARNVGIEHCECTYFTCLDADDAFYSPTSLDIMRDTMDEENLDALFTRILEQRPNGEIATPPTDLTWMHGKMYRTDFIKRNGICFTGTPTSEEMEFNPLVSLLSDKVRGIELYSYMWLNNPKSITKSDPRFELVSIPDYAEALTGAMEKAIQKRPQRSKFIKTLACNFVTLYVYYERLVNCGGYPEEIERHLCACARYWKVCQIAGASEDNMFWNEYRESYGKNLAISLLNVMDPREIISVSQFIDILEKGANHG